MLYYKVREIILSFLTNRQVSPRPRLWVSPKTPYCHPHTETRGPVERVRLTSRNPPVFVSTFSVATVFLLSSVGTHWVCLVLQYVVQMTGRPTGTSTPTCCHPPTRQLRTGLPCSPSYYRRPNVVSEYLTSKTPALQTSRTILVV